MGSSIEINKIPDFKLIKEDLFENGFSGPHKLFDSSAILSIQERVYSCIRKYIINDDPKLPISDRLSLPLKDDIPREFIFNLRKEMTDMIVEFSTSSLVKNIFVSLFDDKKVTPCGSFHDFRGNFPGFIPQATGWHQDAETFFTHDHKEWKHVY